MKAVVIILSVLVVVFGALYGGSKIKEELLPPPHTESEYRVIEIRYNTLYQDYQALEALSKDQERVCLETYGSLKDKYEKLEDDYDDLEEEYKELEDDYKDLEDECDEL